MRVSRARVVVLVCVSNVTVATVSTVLYYRELFILAAAPQFTMQINAAIQCTISGAGLVCLDLSGLAPRRRQAPVRMRVWLGLAALFVLQNTLEISAIDGLGPDNGSLTTVIFFFESPSLCRRSSPSRSSSRHRCSERATAGCTGLPPPR